SRDGQGGRDRQAEGEVFQTHGRLSPLFAPACASAFLTALDLNTGNEGPRPAAAAGTGVRAECAPSVGKGPHLPSLISALFSFDFLLGATLYIPKVRQ